MKIDRLISIIMVLLEREKISASRLAEMFEVTTRTIYRDIETINQAGIPIVTYPGVNGGIGILERYKIDKSFFNRDDISTLLMALGTVSSTLSNKKVAGTLAKVKNLIPEQQFNEIEIKSSQIAIDLTPWAGNRNLQENLVKVKRALEERRLLSFDYLDRHGMRSRRVIEPYQLVLKEGSWYLQSYCTIKDDFRVFKLFRMNGLEVMEESFKLRPFTPKAMDGRDWIEKRLIKIKLLIDSSLLERVIERKGEGDIEPYGDGRYLVELPFEESEFGYNYLLSFGSKCECLEPESVRNELARRIEQMLAIYR